MQTTSSALDTKLRDDLERLKKIRCALGSQWDGCQLNIGVSGLQGWASCCRAMQLDSNPAWPIAAAGFDQVQTGRVRLLLWIS